MMILLFFIKLFFIKLNDCRGFYETGENALTLHLSQLLGIPGPFMSTQFKHWRPATCNFLCFVDDPVNAQVIGELMPCGEDPECCIEIITANADSNGDVTTDFFPPQYEICSTIKDPTRECLSETDCTIQCR